MRTKPNIVDYYIVRKKLMEKMIMIKHESTGHQLLDILTKPLGRALSYKLDMYDMDALGLKKSVKSCHKLSSVSCCELSCDVSR